MAEPDDYDNPWKEALEGAFPEFMAFFFVGEPLAEFGNQRTNQDQPDRPTTPEQPQPCKEKQSMRYITSVERFYQEKWKKRTVQEERMEGRREGQRKGKILLLTKQLERRFGPLPLWASTRIAGSDEEENDLDRWAIAVLTATSLEGVLGEPTAWEI